MTLYLQILGTRSPLHPRGPPRTRWGHISTPPEASVEETGIGTVACTTVAVESFQGASIWIIITLQENVSSTNHYRILMKRTRTSLPLKSHNPVNGRKSIKQVANVGASQYLLLVLYNVQAYIKMLFRVTC